MFTTLLMTIVAYLLGSLSAAIIVSRYLGMSDPRTYGSGNPGASNVLRSGRKDAAALTLLGDALKGLLAVLLARLVSDNDTTVAFAAIAVVLGHMYPLFFDFKGGKGVATALGVILGLSFWTTVWTLAIWLVVAFKFKKSSLAALVAAACAPFIFFIVQPHHPQWGWSLMLISALVLYRHKDNIKRLREGNELLIAEPAQPIKPENQ
ncbi:glycerol-3-phosphate 1-O-acyltransferase PlsY [Alysiella filiformis]|uniref:Glycerol-3-phosphate acyltransferase n=1 Tax=Alysiella filiformis DSM 16848 TaxID=1120981 RepID=A0A286EC85_9NEIS|nr:glycerol-3-phosphate 1-O-acyltransferase PlsY [Alysiella filiformis]QMT30617.1 glycerol-3-phosphate 1-O-acyltransferase PlsY [Alysiella filiformis]UBQ56405.1 glycerol-3-phosphate 1-O-acyltransferase PlsY [Alysiella filiformis DSM 16848]SOD68490.1 glycerol-3-phosphate acyltransferase PlsY [Alysiella filiformis DSM 16848]